MSARRFYVTTPIYYVNAPPHMGTGYTTIIADALARYHRSLGYETLMVTGSDEHSQNIADLAAAQGIAPRDYCSRLIPEFKRAWELLDIGDYGFFRTSSPEHRRTVQAAFRRIHANGDIYSAPYSGWYHTTDNRFVDDSELPEEPEKDPYLKFLTEDAYWFRLSRYQDWLLEYHQANPQAIIPSFRRNEMLNRIKQGLRDLCISRSSTDWGIPLPWDHGQVFYVWVDALWTYMTGSGFDAEAAAAALDGGKDPLSVQPPGNFWPADLHIMAKDIPWFHTIIWPAMLHSAGFPLPRQCLVHGYWNFEGTKMSKSRGNVFHPADAVALVGSDGVRYFTLREVPIGLDGNFSVRALAERYNYDLANDFGNLVYRVLTMAGRFLKGTIRRVDQPQPGHELLELRARVSQDTVTHFAELRFKEALEGLWELVRSLNRFIDDTRPWEMKKDPGRGQELASFFSAVFTCLRSLLLLLAPIIPSASDRLWQQAGFVGKATTTPLASVDDPLPDALTVGKPEIVFPKLDLGDLEQEFIKRKQEQTGVEQQEKQPEKTDEHIGYDDFTRVRIITARVVKAEEIEGADKLLRLTLDDGKRKDRTVVSGIRKDFTPDELTGRTICIVDNLKPRKIFGILSEGMLLAAGGGEQKVTLVTPAGELDPGTRVG